MGESALETGDAAFLGEALRWEVSTLRGEVYKREGRGEAHKRVLMAQHPRGVHETTESHGFHGALRV